MPQYAFTQSSPPTRGCSGVKGGPPTASAVLPADAGALLVHDYEHPDTSYLMLEQLAANRNMSLLVTASLRTPDGGDEHRVPSIDDLYEPVLASAETVVNLHRHNYPHAAPDHQDRVDLIASHGWPTLGTACVRFEPEYHRMVDLPNP